MTKKLLLLLLTGFACSFYTSEINSMGEKPKKVPPAIPAKATREKKIIIEPAKATGEQYIISITNEQKKKLAQYFQEVEQANKSEAAKKDTEIKIIKFINNIDDKGTKLYPDYMGLDNCPLSIKAIMLNLPTLLKELIKNGSNVNIYFPYKNLKGPLLYFACARSPKSVQIIIESKKLENIYADSEIALRMLGSSESLLTEKDKIDIIKMLIAQEPSIKTLIEKEPSLEKIVEKIPYLAKKTYTVTQKNKLIPAPRTKKAPLAPQKNKPVSAKTSQYAQTLTIAQKNQLLDYFKDIITAETEQEKKVIESNIIKFINNIDGKNTKLDPNYKLNANSLINLANKYQLTNLQNELIKNGTNTVISIPVEISGKRKGKIEDWQKKQL